MTRGETRRALGAIGTGLRQLFAVRWVRVVGVLLLLALGARLGLGWTLAFTLERLARPRDLAVRWDDLDLSVLRGRGAVRSLVIGSRPAADGEPLEPIIDVEYAVFDLDVLALLGGELRITRAEVDGMDSWWVRGAEGRWNLEQHVDVVELLALFSSGEAETEEAEAQRARPLDLRPPLAIDALRFQNARFHVRDEAVTPAREFELRMSLELSHLRSELRPARFSATLTADRIVDGAHVEGEAAWDQGGLRLSLRAQAGSLRPASFAPYLAALDIRPAAESIEARARAEVEVAVVGEARDALRASATLTELQVVADGEEQLALDRVHVELDSLSAATASATEVEITGARGRAVLSGDALGIAGLDLLLGAEGPGGAPISPRFLEALQDLVMPAEVPRWAALLLRPDPDAYPWSLGRIRVSDGALRLVDRTIAPEVTLSLLVDELEVRDIVHDPRVERGAIPVSAHLRAPGVAESIELSGELAPFAPRRHLDLFVGAEGIGLESLAAHLERAGLERDLERGTFRMRLVGEAETNEQGRTEAWLRLDELALRDAGEIFGVRSVAATGLVHDPAVPLLRFGDIEVAGPRVAMGRDASRGFFAFGLRTLGIAPGAALGEAAAEPARERPSAGAPGAPGTRGPLDEPRAGPPLRVEIGRFAWKDSDVELVDHVADPPRSVRLDELGFEVTGLSLGGDPAGPEPEPARVTARLRAPGVVEELALEGSVRSRPGGIDLTAELALRGNGLQGAIIAPYLRAIGVEPALSSAELALDAVVSLRAEESAWRAGAELRDFALRDAGRTLLSVRELRVVDGVLGAALEVGEVALSGAFAGIERGADGALSAAGLRLVEVASPVDSPVDSPGERAAPDPAARPFALPELPAIAIARVAVDDARLGWTDRTLEPELATEVRIDAEVTGPGTRGETTSFEARLSVPETLEALDATGELSLGTEGASVRVAVRAAGIRSGPLARLLPPGVELAAEGGVLGAELEATLRPADAGGLSASVAAREVRWGEPGAEPWFALESARLEARRLDPAQGALELGAVRASGASVSVRREADGSVRALGLALAPAARRAAPAETAQAPSETGPDEARAAPSAPPAFERIALAEGIVLEGARFVFRDAALGADARPLAGSLELELAGPCVIVDAEPQGLPALEWRAAGALDGLVASWEVAGHVAPFAAEPTFDAALEASGVRTAGLVEIAPALAGRVTGEVEDGHVAGRLAGTLAVRRARANDLGLSRPFGAELRLEDLAFRDAPGGVVLAGVDGVALEIERVDPKQNRVLVETLDVATPRASLRRSGTKLHVLGLAVELEPPAGAPGDAPAGAPRDAARSDAGKAGEASEALPVEAAARERGPEGSGSAELRIEEIVVSGIDVELLDDTGDPALRIPLNGLDAQVKRFTTRAFQENRPIQFSAYLESAGTRPVFEEISAAGRVAFFPQPSGWAQLSLTGLELPAFAGVAATEELEIGDGALDASVRARLAGERGIRVDATLEFTDLDVDEPEGGPVQRALALPMMLDSALFLTRDADGGHRFSAGFRLDEGGIGGGQIARAATRAFAEVLARALASAPMRLVGGIVPGSGEREEEPERTWELAFAPGSTELDAGSRAALAEIAWLLSAQPAFVALLRHELSADDVARAESLANPSPQACLELARGLRQEKAELARRRAEVAAEAQALYAVGAGGAREASATLRALERDLASIEDGLDHVLDIVRSDAPRRRAKRTRATCREIAELRLAGVTELVEATFRSSVHGTLEARPLRFDVKHGSGGGRIVVELRER